VPDHPDDRADERAPARGSGEVDMATASPAELLRSPSYVALVLLGAVIGVPVAAVSYFFLQLVSEVQQYVFTTLPGDLGFDDQPSWWAIAPLTLAGLLVALTIRFLPGDAGHKPAEGFKTSGPVRPIDIPGIALAAFATLSLGVVLGPEAPLIAIGSGLGVLAVQLLRRDAPDAALAVVGAAGSFAAIATLLGSPLAGAFLLMEAAGLGGAMMGIVLVPGLLAAGIGSLIFVGLDSWTGLGRTSLAIADLPPAGTPTVWELLWAIAIGLLAAGLGTGISRTALALQPVIERRMIVLMPVVGAFIGVVAMVFVITTDEASANVLFSGQDQLPLLLQDASDWTVGALVMLVVCKSLAYSAALTSFRGGPVFPGMFIGGVGGILLSHLPGLPLVSGAAMGIGAMTVAMLGLPLTSVLLVTLFLGADGIEAMPVVILAVAVSYVASARLRPPPEPTTDAGAPSLDQA
jgi:H+/Cl- antiporter ClcA